MKNIYMIGNTHFDPVWLWKWDEAMASIHSTFRSALDRMNEDPDFIYSFATPPVFEWIKRIDPLMFEEISARIKEGRWELCEGMWLQPDNYSAAGESYARQSLYGQRYLLNNFGKYAETVFNIDSFGHHSQTPQLLCKSHVKYYCLCRPEMRHIPLSAPYFKWRGKDGSSVLAHRAGQYGRIYNKNMEEAVNEAEERMQNAPCDELMVYGVTNHGGAPTKAAIADIHRLDAEKPYDIRFSTVAGYFEAQDEPSLTVDGELLTGDFGPYTNNHLVKKRNRIAEYALLYAERASVLAKRILNRPYEKEKLTAAWEDLMFNQFHDILGGASIKDAYFDAYNQQGRAIFTANEQMQFALQSIARKIKTPGKNPDTQWNLVCFNLAERPYHGYLEAEVQWLHEFPAYSGEIEIEDSEGNRIPCQIIREFSVIRGFRSRFLFFAELPAMGYRTFRVVLCGGEAKVVTQQSVRPIQTGRFSAAFDESTGNLAYVLDKESGREWKTPFSLCAYEDNGDTWCFNVDGYGKPLEAPTPVSMEVIEEGIYRTTVKTVSRFRDSRITLYYTFYEKEGYFDLRYVVNWNEPHTVLKLVSDTGYEELLVSSPFASEARRDTKTDAPMGEWLTSYGKDGAVSLIADSLFSYTKEGTKIGLSLLRSCIYGDLRISELDPTADYMMMEQGICEGRLRILLHTGTEDVPSLAREFNQPPTVICEANHDGILAPTASYLEISERGVLCSALKAAEEGDAEILRLYETAEQTHQFNLAYFGKSIPVTLAPYEIKTLKIEGDCVSEVCLTEDEG